MENPRNVIEQSVQFRCGLFVEFNCSRNVGYSVFELVEPGRVLLARWDKVQSSMRRLRSPCFCMARARDQFSPDWSPVGAHVARRDIMCKTVEAHKASPGAECRKTSPLQRPLLIHETRGRLEKLGHRGGCVQGKQCGTLAGRNEADARQDMVVQERLPAPEVGI